MEDKYFFTFKNYNILFWSTAMVFVLVNFLSFILFFPYGAGSIVEWMLLILFPFYAMGWINFRYIAPRIISGKKGNMKINRRKSKKKQRYRGEIPPLSTSKQEFYYSEGLDDDDILFFRKQLQKTKKQIVTIEQTMNRSTKLKVIANRYDLIPLLKDYFRAITQHPKRMVEAEAFLYSYIPSLVEIIDKYLEIEQHVAKSKLTYQTLNRSTATIEALVQNIKRSYETFRADDFEDIELNLQLVEERLKKEEHLLEMNENSIYDLPDFNEKLENESMLSGEELEDEQRFEALLAQNRSDETKKHSKTMAFDEDVDFENF